MLRTQNMKPVCFWPYTTVVLERILETDFKHGDAIDALRNELLGMFNACGIECRDDNKIVFEFLDTVTGRAIYIGFYDLHFSVGYSIHTDYYNKVGARITARTERLADLLADR